MCMLCWCKFHETELCTIPIYHINLLVKYIYIYTCIDIFITNICMLLSIIERTEQVPIQLCKKYSRSRGYSRAFCTFFGRSYIIHDDVIKWKHFHVTGHLCGEFTGHRWIHRTKASDAVLWCFLWSAPEQTVEQTIVRPVVEMPL